MHRRHFRAALVAALLVGAPLAILTAPAAVAAGSAVPRPDHVVVVVEENRAETQIVGNPSAPYITSLATSGANFTSSYAITHPSQPNYIALFSGDTQGITDDSCPHSFSAPSLGDQLIAAGRTFVGYSESMPSAGYTGCTSTTYARKHNPWVDFPAIPAASNQPFSAFPSDYSTLPDVSFVVPNQQNDMHDGTVAQGDAWLQNNLDGYAQWAKTHNSLLIVTFDEDDHTANNQIATIFVGQQVVPGSYGETINHYNVLRTLEDAFGLTPLGASATAAPITDVWTGNRPPTASFTASCTGSTCSFDASASTDSDGTIAGYAWDFGDGSSGSSVTASHTYADGVFTAKLTVTDDQAATGIASRVLSIGSSPPFVSDGFNRMVTGGWGSADVGGAWSLGGASTSFSVGGGGGVMTLAKAGSQVSAYLPSATRTDADVTTELTVGAVPSAGSVYLTVDGRRVSAGNEYAAKVLVNADRSVTLRLIRVLGGTEAAIAGPVKIAGLTYTAGSPLDVHLQVTGTTPAQLRARLWPAGSSEPSSWQVSASDSAAALQSPGGVGLIAYLSGSATNAPIGVTVRRIAAQPTSAVNAPPTAAFTVSCAQLTCAFDGSGSSDDAGLTSWAWTFGDGATGTGATLEHAYAVAGTYTVTLTVTDGQGATGSVSHTANPTPPPLDQPPTAAFTFSCSGRACTFDGTGSTDDEGVTGWWWAFGDGTTDSGSTTTHTYTADGTYQVTLTVTDTDTQSGTVTRSVAAASAFVVDDFNRTVTGGLGTADVGGPWTIVGNTTYWAVASGRAQARMPKGGAQAAANVGGQQRTSADLLTSFALSAVPVGGSVYVTVDGRRVSAGNEYAAKLLVNADKTVTIRIIRVVGGTETAIGGPVKLAGLTYAAGASIAVRLQVLGTAPTTVRARAWLASAAEPTTWPVSASDSTAALQAAGVVGYVVYLGGGVTDVPLTVSFDAITAK